ncbi:MAG: uncharacterized protein QOH26_2089 [Actinomycetota bacterium]|nr:uncharacterized protein [Actinomycetota bacterium]
MSRPSQRPEIVRRQRRTDDGSSFKLVVTGPFSAGKTTFIRTISEGDVLDTDRAVTDGSRHRKPQTTVAMDFGRLSFGEGLTLQLVGTPGQQRFDVMWEILAQGMLGFVLLIDPSAPEAFAEAGLILDSFKRYGDVPFVVAVSHLDGASTQPQTDLRRVRRRLALPAEAQVVACDARSKADVKNVVLKLLNEIMTRSSAGSVATG